MVKLSSPTLRFLPTMSSSKRLASPSLITAAFEDQEIANLLEAVGDSYQGNRDLVPINDDDLAAEVIGAGNLGHVWKRVRSFVVRDGNFVCQRMFALIA